MDMQDAIELIERYTAGKTEIQFTRDSMMRDAVERNIERLSEASRHLTDDIKLSEPAIPWRAIADIGNVLRHGYDRVNPHRVWEVVERDLSVLKPAILRLIAVAERTGKS